IVFPLFSPPALHLRTRRRHLLTLARTAALRATSRRLFWNQAKMTSKQEPWTRLSHSKKLPGWVAYNPKTMRPPPLSGDTKQMKILSWNVNGLRNIVQSGGFFSALAQRENFDVLCLQETHLKGDVKDFMNLIPGYEYNYWSCSVARLDYSGTGVISRVKPISVQYGIGIAEHDQEGRVITLEFENFYLVNAYVPNSGRGLRRLVYRVDNWDPSFADFVEVRSLC
uniref:Endonuclease/exonuclease/phosphatase domain-containing protein n=1 Tax=Aegilops tauschii subsp. strangulata TaxID=200361 RepID=A0A453FQS2_AEGTS